MGARSGRNPKSPAFQFYPGDYLADPKVAAMTTEAEGAYMRLLCYAWIDGGIPSDPAMLAPMCKLAPERFAAIWPMLARCWTPSEDGTRLTNPRQERERAFQAVSRERRKAAGKLAVEQREAQKNAPEKAPQKEGIRDELGPEQPPKTVPEAPQTGGAIDDQSISNRSPIDNQSITNRYRSVSYPYPTPDTLDPIPETRGPAVSKKALTDATPPKKRKPASGPHAELIRHWERVWLEARGTPYIFTAKDASQLATALRMAGNELEQAQRRVSRLILSEDTWTRENASPGLLVNRWNQLADPAPGRPRANEPKGFAGIREYLALHGQTDQSTNHSTHHSTDQQTQESDT